jgi:hypothetical protein
MEAADYRMAWIIYTMAGIVLAFLAWRVLYKYLLREVAYLLQCFLLALMFTPAYVLEDQRIMAPALIVFLMDVITVSPTAGIRALIPLVLALMVALIVAVLLIISHRIRLRRRQ